MNEKNNIAPINEELNVVNNETENIKNLIYNIRGKQVMLDSDVAMLYHYPTKRINETVNRNKKRFPENFCFQLTELDIENMRSQIATASKILENKFRNKKRFPEDFCFQLTMTELKEMWFQNGTTLEKDNIKYRSEKYLPYVYTEQGISMLAGILKNEIAVQVSIRIMRAFIEMRKFILNNGQVFERLTNVEYELLEQNKILTDHEKKFEKVFDELQKNEEKEFKISIYKQIS